LRATIDVTPDIDAYFESIVRDAISARQVEATRAAEHYLALLLSGYARGEQDSEAFEKPLTFLLRDALAASGMARFDKLRRIGDGVLYLLGFFGSAMTKRGADRGYVIQVGSSAYQHASAMMRLGAGDGHDVLSELSVKFDGFVEVLSDVADGALSAARRDSASVLRLYERWQATGSERLAEALTELGLCPTAGSRGSN
jgi:hypothetical protein